MKFSLVLFDCHVETKEGINKQTKTLKMCLDRRITEWKDARTCMAATRLSFLVWQQMMYFSLFHSHFMEQRFPFTHQYSCMHKLCNNNKINCVFRL